MAEVERGDWQRTRAALEELRELPPSELDARLSRWSRVEPAFAAELRG